MKPGQWQLSKGGFYNSSKGQKLAWRQWSAAWQKVSELRKNSELVVIHNGDAIDGNHHESFELVSTNIEDHKGIHVDVMDWALQKADYGKRRDRLYYVRGTDEHVKNGSSAESEIGKDLNSIKYLEGTPEHEYRDGSWVHPKLYGNINGVLFDIQHEGGSVGRRAWTVENGMNNLCKSVYFMCIDYKIPFPRYIIRSHNHKYVHGSYEGRQGRIDGFVTPSLQLKTEHGYKAANVENIADIGMLYIVIEPDGKTWYECDYIQVEEEEREL